MTIMENIQRKRIAGALFGVAVGDALGGPVEFMSAAQIAQEHGHISSMIGGGWLSLAPGEITDDTQMTLCVAEGIVENPDAPVQAIGRRFIEWANGGPKDIGAACASSIHNARSIGGDAPTAAEWDAAGKATQRAMGRPVEGNGALMRTVYPGLYYRSRVQAVTSAERIGRMTHAGARSIEACKLYVRMVNLLTAPGCKVQFTEDPADFLGRECASVTEYREAARSIKIREASGGWVVDSMRIAVGSLAASGTFAEAVETAVNLGGDADTNGAITGGLAGAWYGYDAIPAEWIAALAPEVREQLIRLAEAASKAREG